MMFRSLPGLAAIPALFALPAFAQPAVISAIHQVSQQPPLPPAQPVPPPAAIPDLEPNHRADMRLIAGKRCEVRVWHPDAVLADKAIASALREMGRVANKFDAASRQSEVWSINAAAAREEVLLSAETHSLLQRCLDLCHRTSGAFDLTVASYDYLWNFAARPFVRPLPDEVKSKQALVSCERVALKPNRVVRILQPGVRVTFRDVADGHAVERAAETLRAHGIDNFRILYGRDVYVQGRSETRHWAAAVPHPRNDDQTVAQLYLTSQFAATRADTDRAVIKNGRRYHDVIDPRTGSPADGVVQATVIGTDPAAADAMSAALFVLGPRAGVALVERERMDGFVIDRSGKITATRGMAEFARLPPRIDVALP
jgi:thiamine biosynthesis lipoprotein